MAIQVNTKNWQAPQLGYAQEDVYMDASGTLRLAPGAKPRLSGNRTTLLTSDDGSLGDPNVRDEDLSPEDLSPEAKKRKKVQNKLGGDVPSSAQIDYSMTRQSTLLGG